MDANQQQINQRRQLLVQQFIVDRQNANQPQINQRRQILNQQFLARQRQTTPIFYCKRLFQFFFFIFCLILIILGQLKQWQIFLWMAWYLTLGVRRYDKQGSDLILPQMINYLIWIISLIQYINYIPDQTNNDNRMVLTVDIIYIILNIDYFCFSLFLICYVFLFILVIAQLIILKINERSQRLLRQKRRDVFLTNFNKNTKIVQNIQGQDYTCSICLMENSRLALLCNHSFHQDCIKLWLNDHDSCPVCRVNVY